MEQNIDEIEILKKDLSQIEKSILSEHTKETAKELSNFIKTKQKIDKLSKLQKKEKLEDLLNKPIIKDKI